MKIISNFIGANFITQSRFLTILKQRAFENNVGKRENAGKPHFLFFRFLLSASKTEIIVLATANFRLQMISICQNFVSDKQLNSASIDLI